MRSNSHVQRGLSESAQWALLIPVVLMCLFGIIQYSVCTHARTVTQTAAVAAAEHAAFLSAQPSQAQEIAHQIMSQAHLSDISITVDYSPTEVKVHISAELNALIPRQWRHIDASAVRHKER